MTALVVLFLASLLGGQIAGLSVYPGVVIYLHDAILVILLVEAFIQYALTGKFTKPKLVGRILLFALVAIFSLLTNSGRFALPALETSALYLVRWLAYASVYVLVLQPYTKTKRWLYGLCAVGAGMGLVGLVQFFLYPDLRNLVYMGWDPHFYRVFSTLFDPNFTGIVLVLTILLSVYVWSLKRARLLVVAGGIIAFVSLLLTYSRSSYLALIGAMVAIAILKKKWFILLGVAAFITAVIFLPRTSGSTLDLLRPDSTLARVGNWQAGLTLMGQAPVLGHGFNTLRYMTADNGPVVSKAAAGLDSSILFVGATTGIVGLLIYGYLVAAMIRMGRLAMKQKYTSMLGLVYLSSLIAVGIHSLFVNSAFYPWVMIWLWALTGIVEKEIAKS